MTKTARSWCVAVAATVAAASLWLSACGSTPPVTFQNPDGGLGGDSTTPLDDGGNPFGDGGGKDGAACAVHCSSDLHQVLDCNNNIVSTCPDNQGCAGGACVDACEAAKAGKTTIGCDYWTFYPDMYPGDYGDCWAVYIANTWGSPVSVSVERNGVALPNIASAERIPSGSGQSITYSPLPSGKIPANQVAILFLAATANAPVGCPAGITPALTTDPALHGTGIGDAFHIITSAPVVGYQIYPYGGGNSAITSATLLLPTPAWDDNYVAVDAYKNTAGSPWVSVVAAEDTAVTISPTAAIVGGGGVSADPQGTPITYNLKAGQYLQFVQSAELIGSPIQATKPVAVFGGATCMDVPSNAGACDAAHQQLPPVKALGHEYVGVKYRDRYGTAESPPWRLVGAVDGTTLKWEPSTPAGAPTTLAAGQTAEFQAPGPFVVSSQDAKHPFYMAQYMTGCTLYWTGGDCRGDPEFVNMIPPQQYLPSYVFFTDPTYPETNLVVVREKGQNGFEDVNLDCAGTLTGWQPVGSSGNYEYTRTDLVRHNFQKQGNCDNGRHEISSKAPFGLTVWGWGSAETGGQYRCNNCGGFYSQAVSYGYPAGASVQPINTVVVPPVPK